MYVNPADLLKPCRIYIFSPYVNMVTSQVLLQLLSVHQLYIFHNTGFKAVEHPLGYATANLVSLRLVLLGETQTCFLQRVRRKTGKAKRKTIASTCQWWKVL